MQFRSVHRPPSGRAIAGNRRLLRTYNLFAFTIRKRVVVKAFIVMAGYKKFETAMPKETQKLIPNVGHYRYEPFNAFEREKYNNFDLKTWCVYASLLLLVNGNGIATVH